MNQILKTNFSKKQKKDIKNFKYQFFISLFAFILLFFCWLYLYINSTKKDFSNFLLSRFNINQIYYQSNNYNVIELNNLSIIGVIEIPKIDIKYPILSETTDELLKISACRFYGPYPNKVGNLCIAAHNYDNNLFFSNLFKLNLGDYIKIYSVNNTLVTYYIYNIFETSKNDTSCTNQITNGKKEVTLITCNNITGNRLIVKAKEL